MTFPQTPASDWLAWPPTLQTRQAPSSRSVLTQSWVNAAQSLESSPLYNPSPPPFPFLIPTHTMAPPQQFTSKPSDAIRRRLSSVVSGQKPNVHAFDSLTVRKSLGLICTAISSSCCI